MMKKILILLPAIAAWNFLGCMNLFDSDNIPASYKVECYKRNIADTDYVLWPEESAVQQGIAGKLTAVQAKVIAGYTAKAVTQQKIRTNGSAIVKVYYDRNTVTLTFNTAGGSAVAPLSGKYEAAIPAVSAPVKEGAVFTGWKPALSAAFPAADAVYTAQWAVNAYTVAFNANRGTGTMTPQVFTYGTEQPLTQNAFTRSGFLFAGWNTQADGSGTAYTDRQSVKNLTATPGDTIVLYAQWSTHIYTVEFHANEGTGTMTPQVFTYDTEQPLSQNTFTRSSFLFAGWNTQADGNGTAYTDRQSVKNLTATPDGTVTLYAQWSTHIYTVEFESNGGDGTMASQICTYNKRQALMPNTFTKRGFHFTGWNTQADGSETAYTDGQSVYNLTDEPNGKITLYAQWSVNSYTVAFDANEGTGSMTSQAFTYNTEQPLTQNTFTRTGYRFDGWNTRADGSGTPYTDRQSVKNLTDDQNGTVTLYAQWAVNTYTVEFNANEGTGSMTPQAFTYNTEQPLTQNTFTKRGFHFTGWNTKADGSGTAYTDEQSVKNLTDDQNGTVMLYAQWHINSYTVEFDANEGTDSMTPQVFTYDMEQALTQNTFTRGGFSFKGWNTHKDGSGTAYTDRQSVKNLTDEQNGKITLYAQWHDLDPAAVTDLKAVSDDKQITLSWKNPADEDFEKVVIQYASHELSVMGSPNMAASQTITVGLANGVNYTFTLIAYDKGGNASAAATVNVQCGGNGWLEGAPMQKQGDILTGNSVDGITIPEVVIVPKGTDAIIDMQDDSSWSSFLPSPQKDQKKGAFPKGRKVKLGSFVMGQTEVTRELYQKVTGDTLYPLTHPVESITWYEMIAFCNELTKKTSGNAAAECVYYSDAGKTDVYTKADANAKKTVYFDTAKKGYRLPTETEWEYAARGGNPNAKEWNYSYPGSNTKIPSESFEGAQSDDELDNFAWYRNNSMNHHHEVEKKEPNTLKLYDMSGNVLEACWDWYDENNDGSLTSNDHAYQVNGYITNPRGAASGTDKIFRGGSYLSQPYTCSVAARIALNITGSNDNGNNFGFRICRSQ